MEWKMFGMKGKLASVKLKGFKVFRLIGGLGKEDSNVSSSTGCSFARAAFLIPVSTL